MQKCYPNVTIIIAMLFSIITLYPLLPILAHGQQQQQQQDLFPFSYPTTTATTTKNQTNNDIQSESTTSYSHSFSVQHKKAENNNANVNDNVDVNNPSRDSSNNTPKAVILNFYDNDIGQFTNAKPILDKYGFKGTL